MKGMPLKGNLTDSQYKDVCIYFKREPSNPIGYCFDTSAFQILLMPKPPGDMRLCHGLGISTFSFQNQNEMAHAWVESNGFAYDTTWGLKMKTTEYRDLLQVTFVVKYSRQEAHRLWALTNKPGPWDKKLKKYFGLK